MEKVRYKRYKMVYNVTVIAENESDARSWLGTEYIEPDEITEIDLLECVGTECEDFKEQSISDVKKCSCYRDGKCICQGWEYKY